MPAHPLTEYEAIEQRIQTAVSQMDTARKSGQAKVQITDYASLQKVPYQRLPARWKGRHSRVDRDPGRTRLSLQQTEELLQHCKHLDRMGLPIGLKELACTTNATIVRGTPQGKTAVPVSHMWARRFMKRNRLGYAKGVEEAPKTPDEVEDVHSSALSYPKTISRVWPPVYPRTAISQEHHASNIIERFTAPIGDVDVAATV